MPLFQNPSTTAQGKSEEFYLQVARGHISNHYHIHKFGAVPAMSQNESGTVWDINDTIYPWSVWSTAGTVTVLAVNVSDNGKQLVLSGLDENYKEQVEELTVSSSAPVVSTKNFIRLNRAYMTNGSAANIADITVQKNSTTVLRIKAGFAQTLMAIYTIPADTTGYILKGDCSCQADADATTSMYVRYFGDASFRIGHTFEVSGAGGQYIYNFTIPLEIPEKSDIDVRTSVRANNARIAAAFDILIIDN